tara:strand:+ start:1147 stop:1485 length:339 start_codon:yes stop_codon:yes gene_type:complete
MDNFFLSRLDLEDLYDTVFNKKEIIDMYFSEEKDNNIIEENYSEEANLEDLLASFEGESDETISLKIGMMKKIKKDNKLDNYSIFYLVNSYVNKNFYNMTTYQDKEIMSLIN